MGAGCVWLGGGKWQLEWRIVYNDLQVIQSVSDVKKRQNRLWGSRFDKLVVVLARVELWRTGLSDVFTFWASLIKMDDRRIKNLPKKMESISILSGHSIGRSLVEVANQFLI
jgi:hypothetical protein